MPESTTNGRIPKHIDQLGRWEDLVSNVLMSRAGLFQQLFDPRRDLDSECGYPRSQAGYGIGDINPEFYRNLYERECIATRVVHVMPKEAWQVQPSVYESEDPTDVTPFEDAWDELGSTLRGEQSWYKDEHGSPVWEHLRRADILSGIGHFGVLLLGIDDGLMLDQPAEGVSSLYPTGNNRVFPSTPTKEIDTVPVYGFHDKTGTPIVVNRVKATDTHDAKDLFAGVSTLSGAQGTDAQYVGVQLGPPEYPSNKPSTKHRKLLFLRSFDESLVQIVQYEADVRNPRFGQPVMYRITLNDPREQHSGIGLPMATVRVHWSRVIHLADNLGSSEIFGVPRMRPVLNRLLDLRKLYGGSAEMYWRGAFPGFSIETVPQLGGDVNINQQQIRDGMENYFNGLQRYFTLMGMSAKSLAPQVVDPTAQIAVQVEAICIELGIPIRVFKGSERGELASSQDDASWNDRLRERQHNYMTPRIIVPFIDRLISMGVLPAPKHYSVEWPDLDSLTDKDKAGILLQRTQAYAAYIAGNVESILPPIDFMTRLDSMDEEEAAAILRVAAATAEEHTDDHADLADEHGFEPAPPPGYQKPPPPPPTIVQAPPGAGMGGGVAPGQVGKGNLPSGNGQPPRMKRQQPFGKGKLVAHEADSSTILQAEVEAVLNSLLPE